MSPSNGAAFNGSNAGAAGGGRSEEPGSSKGKKRSRSGDIGSASEKESQGEGTYCRRRLVVAVVLFLIVILMGGGGCCALLCVCMYVRTCEVDVCVCVCSQFSFFGTFFVFGW